MSTYNRYRRRIGDTVNNGVAWKTPSCICSCQWCIKSEVFCSNCWMLRRRLEAATGCRQGPQYDGKCSFYLNCYFFCTSPTNRDLREKAVYFPPRFGGLRKMYLLQFQRQNKIDASIGFSMTQSVGKYPICSFIFQNKFLIIF